MVEKNKLTVKDILDRITPLMQAQTDARMGIAVRLYHAMQAKGWTQVEFAKKMGQKNTEIVAKWLSGTHNFTLDMLAHLEQVLEVKLLITDAEAKPDTIEKELEVNVKKTKAS